MTPAVVIVNAMIDTGFVGNAREVHVDVANRGRRASGSSIADVDNAVRGWRREREVEQSSSGVVK